MPAELFDPMLNLALRVAKKGERAKPPRPAPAKVKSVMKFSKVPTKAKEDVFETLDTDEAFRARVAKAATEAKVGRTAMMFLERPDGWREFVDTMVEAAEGPLVEPTSQTAHVEEPQEPTSTDVDQARRELADAQTVLSERDSTIETLETELNESRDEVARLQEANTDLVAQRQRAVSELKQTEQVMVRHVAERKRLEQLTETMTIAQLSTDQVGGAVTNSEVRSAVDAMTETIASLQGQVDALREAATPEAVAVQRRVPLAVPNGLFDDSVEYAEYLLTIPGMTVLIDGYNVTKERHREMEIDVQRDWLLNGLATLAARNRAHFQVVFDGDDVDAPNPKTHDRVRHRFTPAGIEADDEIIDSVAAMDRTKPVTVVSSDRRVRAGAKKSGANLLHSHQLLHFL